MVTAALDGVLVVDLSNHLSGPFTTRILSDLGARIIKVEGPEGRILPPWPDGIFPGFIPPNVGKESIALDMKSAEGLAIVHDLVRRADILVENFRPGVTARLGVDYETLRAIKPDLIYCSVNGFGSTGPLAQKSAFDAPIQAMSGAMSATGEADRPPALSTVNIGDLAASVMAATAITAALVERDRTGAGQHLDIAMLDSLLYLLPIQLQMAAQAGYVMSRHGSGYGPNSIAGAFRTSDGSYLQILCPVFAFQARLRDLVASVPGFQAIATDARFATAIDMSANSSDFLAIACEALETMDEATLSRQLDANDIPWGRINRFDEILAEPQVLHRGLIGTARVPGGREAPLVRSPFHSASGETGPAPRVPDYGEDGEEILEGLLGYDADRRAALIAGGAVLTAPRAR